MPWDVEFHDAFDSEFLAFEQAVQDALLAVARLLTDADCAQIVEVFTYPGLRA